MKDARVAEGVFERPREKKIRTVGKCITASLSMPREIDVLSKSKDFHGGCFSAEFLTIFSPDVF